MKYRTIVADPPWEYEGFASDPTSGRGPTVQRQPVHVDPLPYQALSVTAISELPVGELSDSDCRLFCWTTNRYLPFAFLVLRAWGFRYTQTIVWHKTGNPTPFGGSVAPNHAEFLLVAVKGKPELLMRLPSNVVAAPSQRVHSKKPEAFIDLVEQVSPGPYVELFSRRHRLGWDVWGNESANTANLLTEASA